VRGPAQMTQSPGKLAALLPGETRVFRTHEHTLGNPKVAKAVEPVNLNLIN